MTTVGAPPDVLGRHLLAELFECDRDMLNEPTKIEALLKRAAVESGATVVASCCHHFNPYGVSGVVVIAESHMTIHTWPEFEYAAIDLFTCADTIDAEKAMQIVAEGLRAKHQTIADVKRGFIHRHASHPTKFG